MTEVRLQKMIADCGYCSRRKAEELIATGHVKVNETLVTEMGVKVSSNDVIEIDGQVINKQTDKIYLVMNKPRGIVTSASDDRGRKTVIDLLPDNYRTYRLFPVGRLDYDTKGVLLLTNDGELMNNLVGPKSMVEKEYLARVDGIITDNDMLALRKGVLVDGKMTRQAKVKLVSLDTAHNSSLIGLIITEGHYHQVKKMCEAIKHPVKHLTRVRFATVTCENLKEGEVRELSFKEVKVLYAEAIKAINNNPHYKD